MQRNSLRSSLSARTYSIAAEAPGRYAIAAVRWSGGTVVALGDIVFFSEPFCCVEDERATTAASSKKALLCWAACPNPAQSWRGKFN